MLKVCYVLSTSENSGGANRSLLELLTRIDRHAVEPVVLMRRHGSMEEELNRLSIPFAVIPFINAVTTGNVLKDMLKRRTASIHQPRIEAFLKDNQVDLLHNNSMPALAGMEAACRCGIPYICHLREDVEKGLGNQFLDKEKHMRIAGKADRVIAVSEVIKVAYKTNIDDIDVIYDGVDTGSYLEKKEILRSNPLTVSIYGNLDRQKGQMVAVKALEHLQSHDGDSITLRIIGNLNTKYGNDVIGYVRDRSIKDIEFIHTIQDKEELRAVRRQDDIELVCSSAEGLGRVTIESMLAGCLTIGADAGATGEIIRDGVTGLLFERDDHVALAERILYAAENRSEMREIAKRGQQSALETFDADSFADRMQAVYDEIICGHDGHSENAGKRTEQ